MMKKDRNSHFLIGAWQLKAFHDIDENELLSIGPLGKSPIGLLIYSADGYMSVNMRADPEEQLSSSVEKTYMSYAGSWECHDDSISHNILSAADNKWIGKKLTRRIEIDTCSLKLYGYSIVGKPQLRMLEWHKLSEL